MLSLSVSARKASNKHGTPCFHLYQSVPLKNDGSFKTRTFSPNTTSFVPNHNTYFETRLLEGNYPDTSRIIPSDFSLITKFNRDEIMQAIDRVSLLSPQDKERNYSIVKFSVTNNRTIEISSSNQEIGDATEQIIPIDNIDGPVLKIGFNSRYLTDAIRSLPSSDVTIKFTGEIKPFVVCSNEYPNLLHVVLPVKLN